MVESRVHDTQEDVQSALCNLCRELTIILKCACLMSDLSVDGWIAPVVAPPERPSQPPRPVRAKAFDRPAQLMTTKVFGCAQRPHPSRRAPSLRKEKEDRNKHIVSEQLQSVG